MPRGRSESPIVPTAPAATRRLAQYLRRCRTKANLTYRQLSAETVRQAVQPDPQDTGDGRNPRGYLPTALSRAADGTRVPDAHLVDAYARACGANRTTAADLQRAAALAHARRTAKLDLGPDRPETVSTPEALSASLRSIRLKAGQRSLREMEKLAGPGRLPHATLQLALTGQVPNASLLEAFLTVCEVPQARRKLWEQARVRADDTLLARRRHDPAPAHTTGSWDRDGFDVEEDEERSSGLRTLLERNVDHEAIAIEYANDKAVNEWQYDSRNDEPPTAPARATRRTVRVRRRRTEPT